MFKSILAAGLLGLVFAGTANAADIVYCNNHNLTMIHEEAAKMNAPDQKHAMEMTMKELEMAKAARSKNDITACRMHAGMAMEHLHGN